MWLPQFGWVLAMMMSCMYCVDGTPATRTAAAKRPKSSSSSQAPTRSPIVPDLCSKAPDMKIICHCATDARRLVTKADCWILGSDLSRKDPIWAAFYAHTSITEVKFITFAQGNLTYVPSRAVRILSILSKISVSFTQITEIGPYALSNATHLAKVEFTNNTQLRSLRRYAFANHPVLFDVNLEANSISQLEPQTFVNLPHLEVLRLGYNNITTLPDDVFGSLGKLKELHAQHNQIAQLSRDIFKGLGNLLMLDLSSNNLTFIGNTVFAELWSLQELAMQNNKIEQVSERAFDGLNNLHTLQLQHNRLIALHNGIFTVVPALNSLNLLDNQLETLTFENLHPIYDNLKRINSELNIDENKLICDCRLTWIFEFRNITNNTKLRHSLRDLECILDPSRAGGVQIIPRKKVRLEYYDTDEADTEEANEIIAPKTHVSDQGPRAVRLLSLMKEQLPCHQELQYPTELPKPQESIKVISHAERDELHQTTSSSGTGVSLVSGLVILIVSIHALTAPPLPSVIN
ncbi:connectin-like [Lutzomyia longipalpis]|uniref:connectin-like n=1 Tax=Lutzomyia longipalpis TaxID=7200 RepID=UPI002483E0FA|nr:connectin-like [Lutzomyia longipalpis]